MTHKNAVLLLQRQERNIRKVNDTRLTLGGYEYRISYRGGFAAYVGIDRREVGRRRFEYFGGFGAYHCGTVREALQKVYDEINRKTGSSFVLQ